ncbi:ABC transporter ATP-binding protein [Actinomadura gamaensis]|uniref:Nickel import system ATP-binding protein NikD n=1 Tax=Actinomadura gamaensis TaxID=1763541 RepID=A0ABV9U6E2_9ACTN
MTLSLRALTVDVPVNGQRTRRSRFGRRGEAVPSRRVVDGLDLTVPRGTVVALAGPSGSGKSLTARSVVGLNGAGVRVGGSVLLGETDLLTLSEREMRSVRGRRVGYAFQDAVASLNPTITIGRHLTETLRAHRAPGDGRDALRRCGLDPDAVWDARPFELSGGQAQRAALALATVLGPDVLIADEVTTALDPVTQAEVLDAVRAQARDEDRAVLLITHDLAVAARWADEIAVVHDGRLVEHGTPATVLTAPKDPFTRDLVNAAHLTRPTSAGPASAGPASAGPASAGPASVALGSAGPASAAPGSAGPASVAPARGANVALSVRGLRRVLGGHGRRTTVALDGVDLDVREGESIAVVGRSGSGKSTLVGALAALDRPQGGRVLADGRDVWSLPDRDRRALRRRTGLVFQDALASFDPRYTVEQLLSEAAGAGRRERADVAASLVRVGLDPDVAGRRPATLSGGERQRVALARALASRPRVLLADEPTTGLDVITQERVLALLDGLRRDEGLAIVFVTHDLRVARRIADRVVVLSEGRIVDDLPATVLDTGAAPETVALLTSTPLLHQPAND